MPVLFQIKARGGECIPVQCDHTKDEDVKQLFERVNREQEGRLDVLVNNAYSGVQVRPALGEKLVLHIIAAMALSSCYGVHPM